MCTVALRAGKGKSRSTQERVERMCGRQPQHDDNCPLRHSPSSPYIGICVVYTKASRRSREGRNLASLPHADPLALWERVRVRVGRQEMQSNATKCNSPFLVTRNEANQGRLAHRLRVNGGPRGHWPHFQGVNEAKHGRRLNPSPSLTRNLASPALQIPSPSGRGLG